jgi:hypothetical protein
MAVCDICSSHGMGTVIGSEEVRKAVKKGFNPMSEGLITNPMFLMEGSSWYTGWKNMVNQDSSDWNICARCMAKLKPYLSRSPKATGVTSSSFSPEQMLEEMSKEASAKATERHNAAPTRKPKKWWEFWK